MLLVLLVLLLLRVLLPVRLLLTMLLSHNDIAHHFQNDNFSYRHFSYRQRFSCGNISQHDDLGMDLCGVWCVVGGTDVDAVCGGRFVGPGVVVRECAEDSSGASGKIKKGTPTLPKLQTKKRKGGPNGPEWVRCREATRRQCLVLVAKHAGKCDPGFRHRIHRQSFWQPERQHLFVRVVFTQNDL